MMTWFRVLVSRLMVLFRNGRLEQELRSTPLLEMGVTVTAIPNSPRISRITRKKFVQFVSALLGVLGRGFSRIRRIATEVDLSVKIRDIRANPCPRRHREFQTLTLLLSVSSPRRERP